MSFSVFQWRQLWVPDLVRGRSKRCLNGAILHIVRVEEGEELPLKTAY